MTQDITTVQDLLDSAHCAVYTYGIVAAYAEDANQALDDQAIHRKLRDRLVEFCLTHSIPVSPAAAAYQLPTRITDNTSARSVAGILENRLCNQWATSLFTLDRVFAQEMIGFPQECALRAYAWSGMTSAFPH
ncbi:MAG: DUF4439 domain-containing protein [Actinomycetes bacterium]